MTNRKPIRIVYLTGSLAVGGAETQLVNLANGLSGAEFNASVVVFYPNGELEAQLDPCRVPVFSAQKSNRWDIGAFILRLYRLLRRLQPDVLHSYLGPSNVFAAILSRLLPSTSLIWSIRASDMDLNYYDWSWRVTFAAERIMSNLPNEIVANSQAGRTHVVRHGFPAHRVSVIANGIDTEKFFPAPQLGKSLREMWIGTDDQYLVGLPARLDPMKDHTTFIRSAAQLRSRGLKVRFVCIGEGEERYRSRLEAEAAQLGLGGALIWVGRRSDMLNVYNAVDLVALSSAFGEGFPNVIGEAMSCGISCVVTDVGDAADVVGDTGAIVQRRSPEALANALHTQLLKSPEQRAALGDQARKRIENEFTIEKMIAQTTSLYTALVDSRRYKHF
jgi:glycosyltransferase involved in cell wall biosynthesis